MANGTYIWVGLMALMLLFFALALLIGRRLQLTVKNDGRARYLKARAVLILYGILFALETVLACHRQGQSRFNKFWLPGCFALCFGLFFFQFLQARRKMLTESRGTVKNPKDRPPVFFWQAAFILLPVVGLAWFGLYSLRQDRLLAEQEAREAGETLAQRLALAAGTEGAVQLRDYRNVSFSLQANRSADLGLSSWSGGRPTEDAEWQRIKEWQQANPEIDLATLPPTDAGSDWFSQPETAPPQPPDWLGQLNPEQQQLWLAAKTSEFSARDFSAAPVAIEKFLASKPPKGARANAEYFLLLAKTRGLANSDAVAQIAEFSRSHWGDSDEPTDAGLPLGQLICYQALRRLPDGAGLPENFIRYQTIAWMIQYRASFFSPRLIAETERVARGTAQAQYAATLKAWWNAEAVARQVLNDFREQYPTNIWKPAPFWVNSRLGKFLVVLGDRRMAPTNSDLTPVFFCNYLLFPQTVVEKALATAMRKSEISLPAYALVEFEMAGKKIALSRRSAVGTTKGELVLLGEAAGLWQDLPLNQHAYPFRIRVSLASPEILYARQSRRTWLFGALIVLSALAALLGLLTAHRAFRRQLQLNELKTNFVSSVSHELRAPIASVRLMAENLAHGKISEPAKQNEYFRFIVQECRRLSALIENVLDFSRIEQGRKQYEFEPTNLIALAETTVKLMEPYAAEKGVRLEIANIEASVSNKELNLDGRAIQQALVNLIDNAIKHSAKGEAVMVEIKNEELRMKNDTDRAAINDQRSIISLSVADHGPGIPAAEQKKIFERFYRRGSELRRETQGVGIGLSLVKHIAEAHGGRVLVQSEPGQGSRFTIELPMHNKETKEQSSA
jgi:signal transduction histidine kinase